MNSTFKRLFAKPFAFCTSLALFAGCSSGSTDSSVDSGLGNSDGSITPIGQGGIDSGGAADSASSSGANGGSGSGSSSSGGSSSGSNSGSSASGSSSSSSSSGSSSGSGSGSSSSGSGSGSSGGSGVDGGPPTFAKQGMYPDSAFLDLTWDLGVAKVTCGDNAAATWSANDFLYGTLGDCQTSINVVEVGGTPYASLTNVVTNPLIDGQSFPVPPYGSFNGKKGSGMLAVGSTIYALARNWDGAPGVGVGLIVSTDNARHFTFQPQQVKVHLGYPAFINFGKGYVDGPPYVYIWGHGTTDNAYAGSKVMHMLRVPKDKILDSTAYEYFVTMTNGQPVWASSDPNATDLLTKAGVVFDCARTGQCSRSGITYNAPLGRYLVWLTDWNGSPDFRSKGTGGFGIYESAAPWDRTSWKTVWHTPCNSCGWDLNGDGNTKGPEDDGIGDGGNFVTKWMSADGLQMYLAYGGTNSFSLRKAIFRRH